MPHFRGQLSDAWVHPRILRRSKNMTKKKLEWPEGLFYNLTHFPVYRRTFRGAFIAELAEGKLLAYTFFSAVAVVIAVILAWVGVSCINKQSYFLGVFALVVVLALAWFMLAKYIPSKATSFKKAVCAADDEAYKAQLKHERDNPDEYQ